MRLCPIAGLLLLALATLPGCGEEGAATPGKNTQARLERKAATPLASRSCRAQLGRFVASLDSLRGRLAVGLTYDSYVAEVRELKRAYAGLPVDRLAVGCLLAVGTPSERALNRYVDAANTWGDCLADASCAPESIEAKLQRGWERASDQISAAQDDLPDEARRR